MYTRLLTRLEFGYPGEIWPRLDAKTNFSGGVNYSFFVFPLFFYYILRLLVLVYVSIAIFVCGFRFTAEELFIIYTRKEKIIRRRLRQRPNETTALCGRNDAIKYRRRSARARSRSFPVRPEVQRSANTVYYIYECIFYYFVRRRRREVHAKSLWYAVVLPFYFYDQCVSKTVARRRPRCVVLTAAAAVSSYYMKIAKNKKITITVTSGAEWSQDLRTRFILRLRFELKNIVFALILG